MSQVTIIDQESDRYLEVSIRNNQLNYDWTNDASKATTFDTEAEAELIFKYFQLDVLNDRDYESYTIWTGINK